MSVQTAVDFIERLREEEHGEGPTFTAPFADPLKDGLEEAVKLGAQMGFDFSAGDLRTAFRHDWQMRWMRFRSSAQR